MLTAKKVGLAFIAAAFLAVMLFTANTFAMAGFTASIKNANDLVGTGTSFLTASNNSVTECSSSPSGSTVTSTSSFPCSGSQLPAVPTTGTAVSNTLLQATGTTAFTSASYNAQACAPVSLADTQAPTDPMLVRGGVSYAQAGPTTLAGSGSMLFNGTDASAVNVTSTAGLQNFTLGIWFKSSNATGALFGWSNSSSNVAPTTYDRHMYFTSAGKIGFSVYSGAIYTITSTNAYNDGAWHYAVVTGQSAVTSSTSTLSMYIDGASVATPVTVSSATVAENTTSFWHVGQTISNMGGYPGNGQFFNGNLSNFTVIPKVLTAANISSLYTSGSQSTYDSRATTFGATRSWKLNDNGQQSYTGTLPGGAGDPCAHIRVTVGTSAGLCLYPVSATACPAQSSTYTLASLASASATALVPSTTSTSQTIVSTVSRDTTYNTNYDVGLHLLTPTVVIEHGFTQTFTWAGNETII